LWLIEVTPVRINKSSQEFFYVGWQPENPGKMCFRDINNSDRPRNAYKRVSCPSGKLRSIFSEIVGHLTNIEGNPTRIDAYPADAVMYQAVIGVRSQTSKEVRQTSKPVWQ